MTISLAGYHWQHDKSFSVVREGGYHGLQLILLQTSGIVKIDDATYCASPNTAFIIDSCVPHALSADGKPYMDDWIRFQLAPGEKEMFDELEIPVNRPMHLGDDTTLTETIKLACDLYNNTSIDNEKIYHNILMVMLLYLSAYHKKNNDSVYIPYEKNLYDLRKEIYANPSAQWSMPQISKDLGLSVGYLNKLYRQLFGTSCMNDVYTARMQYAMELLSDIDTPVFEIAEKCGYNSAEHFSRMFRKYACLSPADYRKKITQ
ncbi:MAG: helix-turn-helix transcriptional regulator [Oscillospiraceae bacterium]|nr:helix-turn-helix transcriptional regulator [Oscillospiraceae bacterium]